MGPDFSKKNVDILAKRAAYKCSNPDCRVITVGPNSKDNKSTLIGEAAHIFGARSKSKRFVESMTDASRAEITNAIWLCRNCHKLIDSDEQKYSSNILFAWRELHEKYIYSELGSASEQIKYNEEKLQLESFSLHPPIIRRIIIDKPSGWEWRLTAELMRHLNKPLFRKIEDLRDGLYVKSQEFIEAEDVLNWVSNRMSESIKLINPLTVLLERLNKSWGLPGESGDVDEIVHVTGLIKGYLEQIINYEEKLHFVNVPEDFENLINLLKNNIGSQAAKLKHIPDELDKVVAMTGAEHEGTIDKPKRIEHTIKFELPSDFEEQYYAELKKIEQKFGI